MADLKLEWTREVHENRTLASRKLIYHTDFATLNLVGNGIGFSTPVEVKGLKKGSEKAFKKRWLRTR